MNKPETCALQSYLSSLNLGPSLHLLHLNLNVVFFSVQIEKLSGEARRCCACATPETDPGEVLQPDHEGEGEGLPEQRGEAQQPHRLPGDRSEEAPGVRR